MNYFDLDKTIIADYKAAVKNKDPYNQNSHLAAWHKQIREKLKYLVETELSKALGKDLKVVYTQRPNKRAGRGRSFTYLDYIIIGFVPDTTNYKKDWTFIKLEFVLYKDPIAFKIELDTDHLKTTKTVTHFTKEYPIDGSFPTNWPDLVDLIKDECELKCKQWEDTVKMTTKNPNDMDNSVGTKPDAHPLNLILYGPPGTGKTYNTLFYAMSIIKGRNVEDLKNDVDSGKLLYKDLKKEYEELIRSKRIVFTTFHQSLSYEDFVEGIKPMEKGDRMIYRVKDGIFKQLCTQAKKHYAAAESDEENKENYVLIIDEINRGNVSQIFGELITLLEENKRLGNKEWITVTLPYSPEDSFGVPNNLYIIGTMNTADRSVEALDTALRRRFSFEEMMPKPELCKGTVCGYHLANILNTINDRIRVLKDRDHQIGHSYLMDCPEGSEQTKQEWLKKVFKDQIIPLLQEYFYGNYGYIGLVLGAGFVKEDTDANNPSFAAFDGDYDPGSETTYRLLTEGEWKGLKMEEALESMKIK